MPAKPRASPARFRCERPVSRSAQPFGRYELLERISAGRYGRGLPRARHAERDLVVALKRILPQIAEDEEFIQMFEDEARIASQLEHPHIARTLDFGRIDDVLLHRVRIRERAGPPGALRPLRARGRDAPAPVPPLRLCAHRRGARVRPCAEGRERRARLDRAPRRVPQNIIVSFDGDVKLIDFGIAKAAGKLSRTQVGTLKGKFGYMAPSRSEGREIDHRADLFSMGICMWELLTLERLFNAENELLVLEKVRSATVAPPSDEEPGRPPGARPRRP